MIDKQAQMTATKGAIRVRSIEHIAYYFKKKITVFGDGVTGCTHLSHGKMKLVNLNGLGIIIVKSDRLPDFKRNLLPYYLFHITYTPDNNTIAVTLKKI